MTEIETLKTQIEQLKYENEQLTEERSSWIKISADWQKKCYDMESRINELEKNDNTLPLEAIKVAQYLIERTVAVKTDAIDRITGNRTGVKNVDAYSIRDLKMIAKHLLVYCECVCEDTTDYCG